MTLSDFQFELPEASIAQVPLEDRAASRMLVVDRATGTWQDKTFRDFPGFFDESDCIALNDSRVIPARLYGHRKGFEGLVEFLLVRPLGDDRLMWRTLARPGRKLRTGEWIIFSSKLEAEILGRGDFGERVIRFHTSSDIDTALAEVGHMPLPPYIHRADDATDMQRYQTVYSQTPGSVAAPTAGLHFTPEILEACTARGAAIARVTLHVGLGTFQPLHAEVLEDVRLHEEQYEVSEEAAAQIRDAKRVTCVGTTSVRTVETLAASGYQVLRGETGLFLYPGSTFHRVNRMLTNFHLPQSSLFILVCAFAGRELMLDAYRHAVKSGYRFYSYGDCMLIV